LGDTLLDFPPELSSPLDIEPWDARWSRYGDPQGEIELRRRLAMKLAKVNGIPISGAKEVQLSFGATGGLQLILRKILEAGDEILTLSPYWTILRVVANSAERKLVEVPFFDRVHDLPDEELPSLLEAYLSPRTRAIYFNSPNNPSGVALRPGQIKALASFAAHHDLWIIADEAYEDFLWADFHHRSIAAVPDAYERTLSVFSFSKSYAAAGLRLGYVAGPAGAIAVLNPAQVGMGYEVNRPAQAAGLRGLARREIIIPRLRAHYQDGLRAALSELKVPYLQPQGSYFLFLDLRDRWSGLNEEQKLERMLEAGVSLSPGEHFGEAYEGWARFCYTCEPPERIAEAARRVSRL
jgi:aspartate/methionine/tyrosine aminotransferase